MFARTSRVTRAHVCVTIGASRLAPRLDRPVPRLDRRATLDLSTCEPSRDLARVAPHRVPLGLTSRTLRGSAPPVHPRTAVRTLRPVTKPASPHWWGFQKPIVCYNMKVIVWYAMIGERGWVTPGLPVWRVGWGTHVDNTCAYRSNRNPSSRHYTRVPVSRNHEKQPAPAMLWYGTTHVADNQ